MKRDAEHFQESEPELIYIARRLKDATALESVLDAAGIDYAVEPDYYQAGVIFRSTRIGAFFYVSKEGREQAVEVLLRNGYIPAS